MRSEHTRLTSVAVILVVALGGMIRPAHSRAEIEGTADKLVIQADQEPLSEIVELLSQKFGVRAKYMSPVEKQISGRFSGSLAAVLRNLFEGYDFVLVTSPEGRSQLG